LERSSSALPTCRRFKRTVLTDLAKADRDAAEAENELTKAEKKTDLSTLTAPVAVGFVEIGQEAEIKIDTFPFTRYGLIHGRVERIAHDAVDELQSEQQRRQGSQAASDEPANLERAHELVYTARIALEEKGLVIDGKPFELAPGVAVVAEIKTGKRRVLDYLLSPLHRYGHDVLRER
jgi:hemolysin D